jgi:hypothetical protein
VIYGKTINAIVAQSTPCRRQKSDLPGIPATGKYFSSMRGSTILELETGNIRRESNYWDAATFMKQVACFRRDKRSSARCRSDLAYLGRRDRLTFLHSLVQYRACWLSAPKEGDKIICQGEWNDIGHGWTEQPDNLEALLTSSHYEGGRLVELRIYPVDFGLTGRVVSQFGIPKRPSPEMARKILEQVVDYSKPFGTKITIENVVGVIRIPASQDSAHAKTGQTRARVYSCGGSLIAP